MDKTQVQKSSSKTHGKQNSRISKTRASKNKHFNRSNNSISFLQESLGNQAVGRMIQAKLTIGEPDDKYEREADQVADKVMRMPEPAGSEDEEPTVQAKPIANQITPLVQRALEEQTDEDESTLQTMPEEALEQEEETIAAKSLIQRQPQTGEEEEAVQAKLSIQRQTNEDDEEPVHAKTTLQRQEAEDEAVQEKLNTGHGLDIQRQMESEEEGTVQAKPLIQCQAEGEEEKAVQTKHLPGHFSPQLTKSIPTFAASINPVIQRACAECEEEVQREPEEEEELAQTKPLVNPQFVARQPSVQSKSVRGQSPQISPTTAANIHSLNSGGSPLARSARSFFEPRFGADFSGVRVHTGARAAETAKSINARAFTVGRNVAFGDGQYAPGSQAGKRLLGHELTHVVQQGKGGRRVQRALKFEIQTSNFIWQRTSSGKFSHVGRKFGEFGKTESGDLPAYITTGKHGVEARKKGEVEYVEVKGERTMKKAKPDTTEFVDATADVPVGKVAQFRTIIWVKNLSVLTSGKKPKKKDLTKWSTVDRGKDYGFLSKIFVAMGVHEFNYRELKYPFRQLPYHQGPDGVFKPGIIKYMKERPVIRDGIDIGKPAQFIKEYKFKNNVTKAGIIGKPVGPGLEDAGEIELVRQKKNTDNPNTFEFIYYNSDGITKLDVHLDQDGNFKDKHFTHMKVGRKKPAGIDSTHEAQYVETWKVTEDPGGSLSFFDPHKGLEVMVKLEEVPSLKKDHSNTAAFPGVQFNPDTYEKKYYRPSEFTGATLNAGARQMNVHLEDGRLKPGHVKFMKQQVSPGQSVKIGGRKVDVGEEQTAMELQAESHGFIEFETPKWFKTWEDLRLRVQDAFEMTEKLKSGPEIPLTPAQRTKMRVIKDADRRIRLKAVGKIREWPSELISPGVSHRLGTKKLFVEIVDDKWPAFFQTSEGVSLSDVDSILRDSQVNEKLVGTKAIGIANKIFTDTKAASAFAAKNDSLFANLKGFLELVVAYIIWGQINEVRGHKDTFPLMARTDFGSMYSAILRDDEKALFKKMVGKKSDASDNPIFITELETAISDIKLTPVNLDRKVRFFSGSGTKKVPNKRNPRVYEWLHDITKGKDRLSGKQKNIADALGGKKVTTTPGGKDYKQALFEKRWGDRIVEAADWVGYAKEKFDQAMTRSADTPDDPDTPKVDESSKTSLKLK